MRTARFSSVGSSYAGAFARCDDDVEGRRVGSLGGGDRAIIVAAALDGIGLEQE